MATIAKNTMFTNVGETSDGGVWWEGLDPPPAGVSLTDWLGKTWKHGNVQLSSCTSSLMVLPIVQTCPEIHMKHNVQSSQPLLFPPCKQEARLSVRTPTPASVPRQVSVPSSTPSGRARRVSPSMPSSLVAEDLKVGGAIYIFTLLPLQKRDLEILI